MGGVAARGGARCAICRGMAIKRIAGVKQRVEERNDKISTEKRSIDGNGRYW